MDLYALPPEEFTAARDAAAKQDKGLKALRRPTVSAWVVNTLVRRDAALLEQLVDLGRELGEAQSGGDAAALRTLGEQRRQLVGAVTQRAVELVDRDVSAAARLEVEQTLEAALADPASAEAVRSGNLTRALAFAGFGGVDLEGAVADVAPARPVINGAGKAAKSTKKAVPAPLINDGAADKEQGRRVAKLEQTALEAQGDLDDAVRHADAASAALTQQEQELQHAEQDREDAQQQVAAAKEAMQRAEEEAQEAQSRRTQVKKAHDEAERKAARATAKVQSAQQAAEAARTKLDAARRS